MTGKFKNYMNKLFKVLNCGIRLIVLLSVSYSWTAEFNLNSGKNLFLFIGLPCSGKTTACRKIAENNKNMVHQSVGDLLRLEAQEITPRGKLTKSLLDQGKLIPFEITLKILEDFFLENQKSVILLDGYQGTKDYIEPFHNLILRHDIRLVKVLSFDVSIPIALERSRARMRADDTPAAFSSRLEIRLKNINDIQEYYDTQHLLIHIDGQASLDQVISRAEHIILNQ